LFETKAEQEANSGEMEINLTLKKGILSDIAVTKLECIPPDILIVAGDRIALYLV